ncbi:MAG: ATP-dependent Clp protease adapter ClpS [Planctomycetes bacterium]|nr:ATP-dependent Clp protease adapter ClpS [Planctomycetota bacterium]
MEEPNGTGPVLSGGVSPGTREKTTTETDSLVSPDRLWNVIVWNDPINLMSYVTFVFQKLFGYSIELATKLMLQVHNEGRSIVASVEREKAEYYVSRLHQYGLQATLEKQDA